MRGQPWAVQRQKLQAVGKAGARDPGQACTRADAVRGCAKTSQCVKQSERGIECVNCVRETPRRTITWGMETPGRTLAWSVHLECCHKRVSESTLPFKRILWL